jgi:hypothetical protein
LTVRVQGQVTASVSPEARFGIRVRSLQNAQVVFGLDLLTYEPRLSEPGSFDATIELQLNTGKGYFSIETPIWDTRERRELGQGPQAVTCVDKAVFQGGTNLHPSVQVVMHPTPATRELWSA